MTNEDLLELIDLLLDKDMASHFRDKFSGNDDVKITDYLGLTNRDLKDISLEENKNIAAVNLFFILNDDIDVDLRDKVLEIINKVNDKTILPKMVTNLFEKQKDKAREIISLFEDAYEDNLEYACSVISNDELIVRDDLLDILEFVLETEDTSQAKFVYDIVVDKDMQVNDNYLNIIKLFSLSPDSDNLKYAYDVVVNENLERRSEFIAIVKLILNARGKENSKYASLIALDSNIQKNIDYLELVKIVACAKSGKQANLVKQLLEDENIILRDDYIDIVKLIADASSVEAAVEASEIALNPKLQKKRKYFKLIEKAILDGEE